MFSFVPKSRTKSARPAKPVRTAPRRGLFETLEIRRVFDAEGVATDAYIFFDPFGGSGEDSKYVAGVDSIPVSAGLDVTGMNNVTVKVSIIADTFNPGTFDVAEDLDGNDIIGETGAETIIASQSNVPVGQFDFIDLAFTPTEPGSYWVVIAASDADGNSAVEYFSFPLEVVAGSGGELPTIDVAGTLVNGTQVDFTASNPSLSGTWLVTFDSDNDGVFETSLGDVADDATYNFTPTLAGNYRVQFETSLGIATSDFTVTQGLVVGGVYQVVAGATDQAIELNTIPTGVTSITINALSGNGEVVIGANVGVPVTVSGGSGSDTITVTSNATAPVTVDAGDGDDQITLTASTTSTVSVSGGTGNDTVYISPAASGTIVVDGGAGNDVIISQDAPSAALLASFSLLSTLSAGSGIRLLTGGSGDDILVGGSGSDIIVGGAGRDIIIGGDGSDLLVGSADDDILIAGIADWSVADLSAVRSIWSGSGNTAQRITALLAAHAALFNSVHDDDDTDILVGAGGTDWFFANLNKNGWFDSRDLILDLSKVEKGLYGELD